MIDLGSALHSNIMTPNSKSSVSKKVDSAPKSPVEKIPGSKFSDTLNEKSATSEKSVSIENAQNGQTVKESAPKAPAQTIEEKKLATRQAAMEIFLDKMQAELGVPSEQVLGAFSSLSLSEMIAPPEDSAAVVIAKLNLSEPDSEKALGLYNEMLAMTAAAGMAQYLDQNGQKADFQVLNPREANLQELRHSIGDMSDRFFVTGTHAPTKMGVDQQSKIARAYEAQMQMNATQVPSNKNEMVPSAPSENPQNKNVQSKDVQMTGALDISEMTSVEGQELPALNMSSPKVDIPESRIINKTYDMPIEQFSNDGSITVDALSNEFKGVDTASQVTSPNFANNQNAVMATGQSEFGSTMSDESDAESDQGLDSQNPVSSTTEIHKSNIEKSFTLNAPKVTPADVQTNVKEIISQAQFLAKKGGGEMSVSLNPEGMGEVSLKVKMINGQVNVEMITSSDEAKKVLEKGLSDLKDSLALHKLHLDTIKIDSTKDLSQHMDQQHKDADHGFQQKFLSDFRDRNNSFKRDMYEFGSPSVPKSQTRDTAANALYDPSRKRRADESRRLDLVA